MFPLTISLLLLVASIGAVSGLKLYGQFLLGRASAPFAETIDLPVDHFNASDTRTFKNRYWMNDTYYESGGPVFLFDGGEAGLSDQQAATILNGIQVNYVVLELARRYHGIAVVWEHRFYGQSLPFPVDNTTGKPVAEEEAYKYLTNEQALEDLVYFATHFKPTGYSEAITSNSTPYIWTGGSYPGIRAAVIRQRSPDVFFASWSSSAPVHSIPHDSVYFRVVEQAMPANCTADIHAAINHADHILKKGSPSDAALVRKAITLAAAAIPGSNWFYNNGTTPEDPSYWQLGQALAYPFQASFVSLQTFGYTQALGGLCNQLEMWNPANFTFTMNSSSSVLVNNPENLAPTAAGIAATYGAKAAFYAYLHAVIQKGIADYKFLPGASRSPIDSAAWFWQLCSQFGQFQVSDPSRPTNIISSFINASSTETHDCYDQFPYAPRRPDVAAILKYGGWRMRPSNVMFTNGGADPWRSLSVQATTDINPHALNRPTTSEVPKCNTPPAGDAVFGMVYPDATHGMDLSRPRAVPANVTTPFDLGIELFSKALDAWLPCFKPS